VSSDDPAAVAAGRRLLNDALEVTVGLGADYLGGVLYGVLGNHDRPVTPTGRANAVAAIRELSQNAARHGVTIGIETVNRYETNLLNTAEQTLEFLDEVGEDNCKVHLDTYHMNIEEDDLSRPVREVGDRLGYVHIGENHRGYLGSGHLDFGAFFHALADVGYTGPITFESFSSAVVAAGLSADLAVWRNLWTDGEDLARQARAYIAAQLGAVSTRGALQRAEQ
jgi:D-psicose/D-tagatose/L-ribulose 3-epimerase